MSDRQWRGITGVITTDALLNLSPVQVQETHARLRKAYRAAKQAALMAQANANAASEAKLDAHSALYQFECEIRAIAEKLGVNADGLLLALPRLDSEEDSKTG